MRAVLRLLPGSHRQPRHEVQDATTVRRSASGLPRVRQVKPDSLHDRTGPRRDRGGVADTWRTTEDVTNARDTSPPSGRVTAGNLAHQAGIGFQAAHTGDAGEPASYTLNGATRTTT